ncbi:MAG: signal peptidase I [Bacilli bacterium]|nr:signal peptidase I [Bacilli bacterium]
MIIGLVLGILTIVGMWKVFSKAGVPGWGAIIPFYNMYLLFKITMGNGWLFLLLLIPFVNFVMLIIVYVKLAAAFNKGAGYTLGLIFLSPIFIMMLGFGSAQYIGTK